MTTVGQIPIVVRQVLAMIASIAFADLATAQKYIISTVAGGVSPPTPTLGTAASLGLVGAITASADDVYFTSLNSVFKLDQNGVLTLIAGNSRAGYSGDGGPAVRAQMNEPSGIATDSAGNIYIADTLNNRIRRVSASGIITTVIGDGRAGSFADGVPATSASLNTPRGVAIDTAGTLYVADSGNARIRKVPTSGIITTVAGNGAYASSGDGGDATSASVGPEDVAVDQSGNLYISETQFYKVRKVSPAGTITTFAGSGVLGCSGDGVMAETAQIGSPSRIAVDRSGNLYIADGCAQIREVTPAGTITTVAKRPTSSSQFNPAGVAVTGSGTIFASSFAETLIVKVNASGMLTTVAGNGIYSYSGDGGPATSAQLSHPTSLVIDSAGNLVIADFGNNRVRRVSPAGVITLVAGGAAGYPNDGGSATSAGLRSPSGLALDATGNLYIAEFSGNRIRRVSPGGIITTVAGNGSAGYTGDGGPATNAQLNGPGGLAVDSLGNLFIADSRNAVVRRLSVTGILSTVAGNGKVGYSGDGGPATSAQLSTPTSVAIDTAGNLYIADWNNSRIRLVSATNQTITTFAGGGTQSPGDGGFATGARLDGPLGLALDSDGSLFIADHPRIRKVNRGGVINTIAGNANAAYSGDGGPGTTSQLGGWSRLPFLEEFLAIAVDSLGNAYVADSYGNAVRLLRPTSQSILVGAVIDAANESAGPLSPGKIVVIYGAGLGPPQLAIASPSSDFFGTQLEGTTVTFNGIAAPLIYASNSQVAAIVPYAISGPEASVGVSYQSLTSAPFTVAVSAAAPSIFSLNLTGAGQAAAVNLDGSINDATHPAKVGSYISLYVTGEGQTTPAGIDGKLALTQPLPHPDLPVTVTVDGQPATFNYAGAAPTEVAGLMQINVQVPNGVQPGGYVPVVLQVGSASTVPGAVWIAVSKN
jgi:trimeric autotransporter adhesin